MIFIVIYIIICLICFIKDYEYNRNHYNTPWCKILSKIFFTLTIIFAILIFISFESNIPIIEDMSHTQWGEIDSIAGIIILGAITSLSITGPIALIHIIYMRKRRG